MKRLLSIIILIIIAMFVTMFGGCSTQDTQKTASTAEPVVTQDNASIATVEPTDSPSPYVQAIHVRSNSNDEAENFEFTCNYDINDDGNEEEIKLMVEHYNEPTLVVGDASVKFSEHMLASYDCGSTFMISNVNDGKLIYFVSVGGHNRGYDVHCAYYENGKLYEVRFPEWLFFTEDKEAPFVGTWTGDNTFDIKCLYDNSIKHATLDTDKIDGFEPSWRELGFGAVLDNSDGGPKVIDDTVYVTYELTIDEYLYTYAYADCTFKFDKDNMSMTFVSANYSATHNNLDRITF